MNNTEIHNILTFEYVFLMLLNKILLDFVLVWKNGRSVIIQYSRRVTRLMNKCHEAVHNLFTFGKFIP